jgi:hypothetical protein
MTTIVTLKSLIANGKTNESDTTALTLVTDIDIKELASTDVVIVNDTITGASIQVTDISGDHNGYVINILGS